MRKYRNISYFVIMIFIIIGIQIAVTDNVYGAQLNHGSLPTGITPESLKISWDNASYENRNTNIYETDGYCRLANKKYRIICIPKIKGPASCLSPFTIRFKNAGRVKGIDVDVLCEIEKLTLFSEWSGIKLQGKSAEGKTWMSVAYSKNGYNNGMYAFGDENGLNSFFYDVKKSYDCRFSIVKKGTSQIVPCRFFVAGYDIDWYYNNNREEYFEFDHSSFESLFTYESSFLSSSGTNNMQKYYVRKYNEQGLVEGMASWYKAGVIGVTPQNSSYAKARITVSNSNIPILLGAVTQDAPIKTVDREICQPGDIMTYNIIQKNGKYVKNTFKPYRDFVLKDIIPQGTEYVSARVFDGSTDITNQAGLLEWNNEERAVTYAFSDSWLSNMNNYKGQDIKMEIRTRADAPQSDRLTVSNKATTIIDGLTGESNEVKTTIVRPELAVEKISEGKELYYSGSSVNYKVKVYMETLEADGRNVLITDELPDGISCTETPTLTGVRGSIKVEGKKITCSIPLLRKNEIGIINIPAKVEASDSETVRNTAHGICDGGKPVKGSVDIIIGKAVPKEASVGVIHTDKWQENLNHYNNTVAAEKRREQNVFWSGEYLVVFSELKYESPNIDPSTLPTSAYILDEKDDAGMDYRVDFDKDYKIEKTSEDEYTVRQRAVLWDASMFMRWGGIKPKKLTICCQYGDSDKMPHRYCDIIVDNRNDYYMLHRKE